MISVNKANRPSNSAAVKQPPKSANGCNPNASVHHYIVHDGGCERHYL